MEEGFIAVASRTMDEEYRKALLEGKVLELQARWRQYRVDYREAQHEDVCDPTYGTLIYSADARCRRGEYGGCLTHGEPDWTQCDLSRVSEGKRRMSQPLLMSEERVLY